MRRLVMLSLLASSVAAADESTLGAATLHRRRRRGVHRAGDGVGSEAAGSTRSGPSAHARASPGRSGARGDAAPILSRARVRRGAGSDHACRGLLWGIDRVFVEEAPDECDLSRALAALR